MQLSQTSLMPESTTKAYWSFNASSSVDNKNSNNGSDTSMTYSSGKYGAAAVFDGSSSTILVANSSDLNVGASFVSLVAWVNPTNFSSTRGIISKGFESANQGRYRMYFDTSGFLNFRVVAGSGRGHRSNNAVTSGVWSHVVAVCDLNGGTTPTFYINGVSQSTTLVDGSAGTYTAVSETNQLGIGCTSNGSNKFLGSIDDAAVINKQLSQAEVTALYQEDPGYGAFFMSS